MSTFEIIGILASVITAIVAVIGVYPLIKSLRHSEVSLRFGAYYQILDMTEKVRESRHFIYEHIPENADEEFFRGLKNDELLHCDNVIRAFDKIGAFVKYGVLPINFVVDLYSFPITLCWRRLKPLIEMERKKRNQSNHFSLFEQLANEVEKYLNENGHPIKWQLWSE